MKLLFLAQGKTVDNHPGFDDAFQKLVEEGVISCYHAIPYLAYAAKGDWQELWDRVVALCRDDAIDLVFFQFYHRRGNPSPEPCIRRLRDLPQKPTIFTSAGDPFSCDWRLPDYPASFKQCSRLCDLTFSTQMGKAADKMAAWGARNIVLSPLSVCQKRFVKDHQTDPSTHKFDFDLVMVGSHNKPWPNPFHHHFWGFRKRMEVVSALYKRYGKRFGLFGRGWDGWNCWQGPIPFDEQQTAFRRGRLVVDGYPYSTADYYLSDRPFFALAAAIPVITYCVPRIVTLLRPDEHWYLFGDTPGLLRLCDRLLAQNAENLYDKANAAARYVEARHTQYHRMKAIVQTASTYHMETQRNQPHAFPLLPFFLDGRALSQERAFAVRNWKG
jgi:hypothetical protein